MSDNGKNGNGLPARWQAYTLDTELDRARALFEHRHGCPPSEVVQSGPILLAGPIGGNGLQRPHGTQPAQGVILRKTAHGAVAGGQAALGATGRQLTLSFEGVTR